MRTNSGYHEWIILAAVGLLVPILLLQGCANAKDENISYVIAGRSMAPRLNDGDQVTLVKGRDPDRFDLVVYKFSRDDKDLALGRVVGLPGENVVVNGPTLSINGNQIEDTYAAEPAAYVREFNLAEGEYVVLQDQRNIGDDSHSRGPVEASEIVGSAPPGR